MKAPTLTAGILSALLIVGAATALVPATAQQQPAPQPQRERPLPGRHVEGRIAYMWAELRITPAQQAQGALARPVRIRLHEGRRGLEAAAAPARQLEPDQHLVEQLVARDQRARAGDVAAVCLAERLAVSLGRRLGGRAGGRRDRQGNADRRGEEKSRHAIARLLIRHCTKRKFTNQ